MVDEVRQHVEATGEVGAGGRRLVLVAGALRPAESGLVPERSTEDLVPREHVAQDLGVLAGGDARPRGVVQPVHPRRLVQAGAVGRRGLPAQDRAGREVRPALLELAHERGVRRGRHHVVGVEERQVVAPHVGRAHVAGRAETTVVGVHYTHPGIAGGVLLGDLTRRVGRAVVDHHHVELPVAGGEHAVERLGQPLLDAVGGHHDTQCRLPPMSAPGGPLHAGERTDLVL